MTFKNSHYLIYLFIFGADQFPSGVRRQAGPGIISCGYFYLFPPPGGGELGQCTTLRVGQAERLILILYLIVFYMCVQVGCTYTVNQFHEILISWSGQLAPPHFTQPPCYFPPCTCAGGKLRKPARYFFFNAPYLLLTNIIPR